MENVALETLERQFSDGSIDAMREYAQITLRDRRTLIDKIELKRRQTKLAKADFEGNSHILGLLIMISAHIPDFRFCDFWISELENVGEPASGFYAYEILKLSNAAENRQKGFQYLESSAESGFLEARRELFKISTASQGWYGKMRLFLFGGKLAFEATRISRKDENDPRLPRFPNK